MCGCESWTIKKAEHRRTDAFELWCWRRLESSLDCKEIQPVHPKGNQSWIFIGRIDAETPILWLPDAKNWLIWKDRDAGKDWRWEKGMTENEMIGWHHQLNGHEFEQALGVGDGQGGLACYSPWDRKELDTTEQLNWTCMCLVSISLISAFFSIIFFSHFLMVSFDLLLLFKVFSQPNWMICSSPDMSHNFQPPCLCWFGFYCL